MLFYYQSQALWNQERKASLQNNKKALVFIIGKPYSFTFIWCFLVAVVGYIVKLRGNPPI